MDQRLFLNLAIWFGYGSQGWVWHKPIVADPDPAVPSICPDPTLQKRNIACLALIFTFCIKTRKIYQTDPLIYLQVLAKIS